MNQKQRMIVWAGVAVVILIGMFPPWTLLQTIATGAGPIRSSHSMGYAPIFAPPSTEEVTHKITLEANQVQIDATRLGVELIFTIVVIAGLVMAFNKKDERTANLPRSDQTD